MYKTVAITCGLLFFSTAASAQRFNAFLGYSYSGWSGYGPSVTQSPKFTHSLNGWNGSIEAKVLPVLGIVMDLSGYYGKETATGICFFVPGSPSVCVPDNAKITLYAFTLGPQVSLRLGRFRPYAHALFGGALYRNTPFLGSERSFVDVLGGGIDFSLTPWLAWRAQANALQTRFFFDVFLAKSQTSVRLSTGPVFRF